MTSEQRFEQLVRKIDPQGKLLRAWPLTGGYSAQVTGLEIERADGQRQKLIVRQHGAIDLQHNPNIAADEFELLQFLKAAGLAVPQPYHVGLSGDLFSTPCIVVEFVEGVTEFAPPHVPDFIRQTAGALAQIHQVNDARQDLAFLPRQRILYAGHFNQPSASDRPSPEERQIRVLLAAACPLIQVNSTVLLHGDFWPGNLLWKDGLLAAVIDWEDAALGDPLADLANARLEILWAFGDEAMQNFTRQYQALLPGLDYRNLPYWELYMALRPITKLADWALDAATETRMRERLNWFIAQALKSTA